MEQELKRMTGLKIVNVSTGNNTMTFMNGSVIDIGYCRNKKDVMTYQGLEYDFICIEELTQRNEEEFRILMNCLRSTKPGVTPTFF